MKDEWDATLRSYAWNLLYAEALVADLSEEEWTSAGGAGLENHPAWIIGHLVSGADMLAASLGLERELSPEWRELFDRRGPGDPRLPHDAAGDYPSREELLAELRRQHDRVTTAWRDAAREGRLDAPLEWRFGKDLPTVGDMAVFMAVTHEVMHLGQIACWRRARGLPSALASLR